jgi:DNA-binding MarR family transcriptional regulator
VKDGRSGIARHGQDERLVLGLLESLAQDSAQSQRRLAVELGIAVGLVNAYLNRCIQKGFVKVTQAPARRFAYYLTPKGFAEKSRLSLEYLTYSFAFFRRAKNDCRTVFEKARVRGIARIALGGISDLAEIAIICARESDVEIVAIVEPQSPLSHFAGLPIARSFDEVADSIDGVVVTDLMATSATFAAAAALLGKDRVLVPGLLQKPSQNAEALT